MRWQAYINESLGDFGDGLVRKFTSKYRLKTYTSSTTGKKEAERRAEGKAK